MVSTILRNLAKALSVSLEICAYIGFSILVSAFQLRYNVQGKQFGTSQNSPATGHERRLLESDGIEIPRNAWRFRLAWLLFVAFQSLGLTKFLESTLRIRSLEEIVTAARSQLLN